MAVPANRVPVRVARGLKAALTANLADFLEGEVLYAKDEDRLYIVEGGVLVPTSAELGASSIGELSDVTITAAVTGEVLRYDGASWVDAQLDYADLSGTPTNVSTFANDSGYISNITGEPIGDLSDVTITAAATGEVLRYNGAAWVDAQLDYADLSGTPALVAGINDLTDVDTTTTPPTDGQVLKWNNANSEWEPGDAAANVTDLTDTIISSPQNGQALIYSGGNWINDNIAANLGDLTDVAVGGAVAGQDLQYNGSNWVNTTFNRGIDELSDVDTTTSGPTANQTLQWNGVNWIPASVGLSGATVGFGSVTQVTEVQVASGGEATFANLGQSGVLVSGSSDIEAWVVLYPTAAERTADAGRNYGLDPSPGSGVLAEFLIPAAGTVIASPGTYYFNNDTAATDAIYAAVRTTAGANADAQITLKAYKQTAPALGIGGTTRTTEIQAAAGGTADFTAIGVSGTFVSITSDINAWVTFYSTAAERTADSGRTFITDPIPGDGVLLDIYIPAGQTTSLTPAMGYFNNDAPSSETIYAAVRDTSGVAANATLTVRAYAQGEITSFTGGTFGSG